MSGILSKERIVAKEGFNRWLIAPAALGIHLCIGSVYAWSLYNPALIKRLGVVTSSADDWTLKSVVWVFTVAIVFLGLSAAVAGHWLEKVGPRMVGTVAAFAGVVDSLLVASVLSPGSYGYCILAMVSSVVADWDWVMCRQWEH